MSSTQDRDDGRGDRITTLNTGWKQIRRPKPEKTSCKRKQTRRENAKDEKATIRNTQQRQKRTQNETVKTQVNKHQSLTTTRKHSQNTSVVRFPFGSVRAVLTRHVLGGRGQSYHTSHTHTTHQHKRQKAHRPRQTPTYTHTHSTPASARFHTTSQGPSGRTWTKKGGGRRSNRRGGKRRRKGASGWPEIVRGGRATAPPKGRAPPEKGGQKGVRGDSLPTPSPGRGG